MKLRALLSWAFVMLTHALVAQTPPDLSRASHAQRAEGSALTSLGPALIFFVGLALIALMLLLSSGSKKRPPGPPRPPGW